MNFLKNIFGKKITLEKKLPNHLRTKYFKVKKKLLREQLEILKETLVAAKQDLKNSKVSIQPLEKIHKDKIVEIKNVDRWIEKYPEKELEYSNIDLEKHMERLRFLIRENDLEMFFEEIKERFNGKYEEEENETILLQARFSQLSKDNTKGVILQSSYKLKLFDLYIGALSLTESIHQKVFYQKE